MTGWGMGGNEGRHGRVSESDVSECSVQSGRGSTSSAVQVTTREDGRR